MIDPPEGWKYGFPKRWDAEEEPDVKKWLISEGYPKEIIEEMGEYFFIRGWNVH